MKAKGWARRVYIFAKPPCMGRVKTRLAADIGAAAATAFYRRQTGRLVATVGQDLRWRTALALDGARNETPWSRAAWTPQGGGDLGDRMARVFRTAPPGPVVIIGSDIPGLTPAHIASAFEALKSVDAVFGPAFDGGYWLIGLRRLRARSFDFSGVRWSTAHALADTRARLPKDYQVKLLCYLRDVDAGADYKAVKGGRAIL